MTAGGTPVLHSLKEFYAPFEGRTFDIPVGAERVLEGYYGDWRRVPPAEERPPAHLREVTWVGGAIHD